jgi:hypothetical protein
MVLDIRDGMYCVYFFNFKIFISIAFTIKALILKRQWNFEDEFRMQIVPLKNLSHT